MRQYNKDNSEIHCNLVAYSHSQYSSLLSTLKAKDTLLTCRVNTF